MATPEPFLYNPDFEWFESCITVKGTPVQLFLSEETGDTHPDLAVHEQLGKLAVWTRQHAQVLGSYCASAIVQRERSLHPLPDLSLLSVWVKPGNYFELLFRMAGNQQQFLIVGISHPYRVDYWKVVRR